MLADLFGPDLLIVIIVVVVLLFGGAAIPKLARNLGSAKNQFEQGLKDGKGEAGTPDGESGPTSGATGAAAATDTPAPVSPPPDGTTQAG